MTPKAPIEQELRNLLSPDLAWAQNPSLSSAGSSIQWTGITADSREVSPGMLFVAVSGTSGDGHRFIEETVRKGALAVVGELPEDQVKISVPYISVKSSRRALAKLASHFYGNPSHEMLAVGVTGTSGKTTVTYLIESIFQAAHRKVGVIGTVNCRIGEKIFEATHTTPGPVALQKMLRTMRGEGCTAVVMEVSSHALDQDRVHGMTFDGMIFTNLTPEHQDYHPTMEEYFQAKAKLFKELPLAAISVGKKPVGVVNQADPYGKRLLGELASSPITVQGFGESRFEHSLDGISGTVCGIEIRSSLVGEFNGSNISAAVTLVQLLGIDRDAIFKGIQSLSGVPGRLERVPNAKGIHVWVDYAHKPDALEKVIASLLSTMARTAKVGATPKLITVVGCGGDRDRAKRPLMGKIATTLSDWTIITSDNPRTEDPNSIIQEILAGIKQEQKTNYEVEPDRKRAIFKAIAKANRGDLILIAGKGHEDYQILGTTKIHFDDREIAHEALNLKK